MEARRELYGDITRCMSRNMKSIRQDVGEPAMATALVDIAKFRNAVIPVGAHKPRRSIFGSRESHASGR